ncbi:unnamed protein product [Zymoseptoria tritici ST99CH_1E4]|uniref:P450 monooxygenase n=1 Tax=Zymoseptoria tritici ST99CH_1E4 TaxID=1276532 RepID=A0A2H1FYA5_ZYMTR|nr:unnamed protein product [Zymoseptoria tritici ST99CH_1E4]
MELLTLVLQHPFLAIAAVLVGLYAYALVTGSSKPAVPGELPWVGKKDGQWFSLTRATWMSVGKARQWLHEGYTKFGRNGKSYLFPDVSGRHEIVLPPDQLRWLTNLPDSTTCVRAAHYDILQGDYAFTDKYLLESVFHERVVHKNLARKVDATIPAMWDEIDASFRDIWGTDTTQFKDIPLWDSVMAVIARLSNRLFVGLPLCRDKDFLAVSGSFAMDVITLVSLLPLFPKFLQPILGRLGSLPGHYHYWRTRKHTLPIIRQRLADITALAADPTTKLDRPIPEDYITWHIRTAMADNRPKDLDPVMISRFLLPIEFAAIHTTALTLTNILFDLYSSDPSRNYIASLREEATRLHAECNGNWTKQILTRMLRTDSAIRESMRISNFATRAVLRKVISPAGLTHPTENWHTPEGSYVSVDQHSVHHDPAIYPSPEIYDAFRFSRPREEFEAKHAGSDAKTLAQDPEYLAMRNLSMTTTGENFLAFGHGRHACPGRFFVQHELKMVVAYVVMNYEVEVLPERPKSMWLGTSITPDAKKALRVRRREGTV